jgi:nickel/cobalt exporter
MICTVTNYMRHRHLLRHLLIAPVFLITTACAVMAHPLGNFTVNHFVRLETGPARLRVHYVMDMAEIPAFQAMQEMGLGNAGGTPSKEALDVYLLRVVPQYAAGLLIDVDGTRVPLRTAASSIYTPQGSGGLRTLRVECDFEADVPAGATNGTHRLRLEDTNQRERIGWQEIVVVPASGVSVFNSSAYGSAVTDELKTYPQDMLSVPLDERAAELSWTSGPIPAGAAMLRTRDGRLAEQSRDRFAELISVRELTPPVVFLGLLLAAGLGALHAFSPGHGKTVVGAYLVGTRGTARHAAFLGLTVTVTHTLGVFALGLVTLFASQYILPEKLFPILGFVSGALVLAIGLSLFVRRLRSSLGEATHGHAHHSHTHQVAMMSEGDERELEQSHHHQQSHVHDGHAHQEHTHQHDEDSPLVHSHGGSSHSHLPPGTDGSRVTWRSLLALGISGGLLPCPSALVVLLSAISLHRVGYGLVLVFAFSVGLAATLTAIGLAFVYAGRLIKGPIRESRIVRVLPVLSALVIACLGAAICYEALAQSGVHLSSLIGNLYGQGGVQASVGEGTSLASLGAFAVLGLGLLFGLKHATEVDHVVAVSTIVSEHRSIWRSALVGGLWGMGHTASLIIVGVIVLALRVAIPEHVSNWLEFGVALMIIGLGTSAFVRALRGRSGVHLHQHAHEGEAHAHIHFHEDGTEHAGPVTSHSHDVSRIGFKPLLVGAMHGLAGSGALTVLVLAQIDSAILGLLYLTVFGIGSIIGMLLMSFLVGLPFALSARRLNGFNYGLQTVAGILSIAFGLWYAYETGIASGLLRAAL